MLIEDQLNNRKGDYTMNTTAIHDLIVNNELELHGQPKWTFGKNTCNTYDVFVEKVHLPSGDTMLAWPIIELIEKDEKLTSEFSHWFFHSAMKSAMELADYANANVTISLKVLPHFANNADFVKMVLGELEKTGLPATKLLLEVSRVDELNEHGIQNLNILHDEHSVGLILANFGKGTSNIDLLKDVHFDGVELDRFYTEHAPEDEQVCRLIVAIIHFVHVLDMYFCANGIETQDQFEFFEELDCLKGQGSLIGKSMPLSELREYIAGYALKRDE